MSLRRWNMRAGGLYCLLIAVFVALPILSSFVFSFGANRFPTIPPGEWDGRWYMAAWEDAKDWAALRRTLLIGFSASVVAVLGGFCAAYTDFRWRFRGKNIFLAMVLLPPTVPLVIFGLAMLAYLSRVGLSGSPAAVWISHVVMCMPFAMAVIRLRLHQMDANLEAAAWNLGAGEWRAMREVVFPFTRPAILAALLLSMAVSFDEYAVAWFVSGVHETLPVRVLNFLQGQVSPRINVIGTFTFTATIALVVAAEAIMFGGRKWRIR